MTRLMRLDSRPFRQTAPVIGDDGAYRPVSFWQETVPAEPGPPLAEDTTCDVAILGGGYTGLSTAYALRRAHADLDVVVLERATVGHGASGRNGGFVMPLLGWNLVKTTRKLGRERARLAYEAMFGAVDHTVRTIREESIDCDLEQSGYLLLATAGDRSDHVRREAQLGAELGFGYQYLEGDALRAHVSAKAFRAGCYDPRCAIINPAKLAHGLGEVVRRLGGRIYEQTAVDTVDSGERLTIRAKGHTVRARAIVVAANAYGGAMGFLKARVLPVHTYVVLTEPLSRTDLAKIGWNRRTSLETARNFIHYFRLTADNRILFGGDDAKLYADRRYRDHDQRIFLRLEARLRSFFPELGDIAITHRWGGPVGVTVDMLPTFGASGQHGNVFHACGYSGHGVALANYAGALLVGPILQRLGIPIDAVAGPMPFGRLPPWLPPGPLTYAGMQLYRLALHASDRWNGA